MSAPLILPKGNDRTWTRSFYYSINKVFRRMWWEQRADEQIENALATAVRFGMGYIRVDWNA